MGNIVYQDIGYLTQNKHRSCREIGKELGVSHKTISWWFKKYNISLLQENKWSVGNYTQRPGWKHSEESRKRMSEGHRKTARKGESHWSWKGGISPIRNKLETTFAYKEWRRKVFERDNYTCQDCGHRGGYLEAHHKKPFLTILHEIDCKMEDKYQYALSYQTLWDISNGITYCVPCHAKHDKQRRGGSNHR